jgi:molybdenum cofactor cytidylyltransferase
MTAALPPRPRVAAVVLAAGSSTRMGAVNKLLADIDGVPMLRRVVAMLRDPRLAERIVVTGAEADAVRAVLAGLDVRFSHNAAYDEGIASSIRTGVAALPPDVDGALIVLGDMPRVAAADVALLLDAFDPDAGRSICVPVRAGRRGNPVLWAARWFPELQALPGDAGGRRLFDRLAAHVCEVAVAGDGVLLDVDTPAALRDARQPGGGDRQ